MTVVIRGKRPEIITKKKKNTLPPGYSVYDILHDGCKMKG